MAKMHGNVPGDHERSSHDPYADAEEHECPSCGREYVQLASYYRHVFKCGDET